MKPLISFLAIFLFFLVYSCEEEDMIVQSLLDLSGAPLEYDDSGADLHLNVATVSMECSKDKNENLVKIQNIMRSIVSARPEVRLIVFGETVLGWYYDKGEPENYQRSVAETIPGNATNIIGQLADSLDVFVVIGMTENDGDKIYNSQVLINPDGMIQAVHRKVHFVNYDEMSKFSKGESATYTTIDGIRTGLIICADVNSYSITEELVESGITLLIHSLASNVAEFTIDAVARQFNAWVVFANRYGKEGELDYSGTCYIADPAGTIRTGESGKETYSYYRIGVYQ